MSRTPLGASNRASIFGANNHPLRAAAPLKVDKCRKTELSPYRMRLPEKLIRLWPRSSRRRSLLREVCQQALNVRRPARWRRRHGDGVGDQRRTAEAKR